LIFSREKSSQIAKTYHVAPRVSPDTKMCSPYINSEFGLVPLNNVSKILTGSGDRQNSTPHQIRSVVVRSCARDHYRPGGNLHTNPSPNFDSCYLHAFCRRLAVGRSDRECVVLVSLAPKCIF
jgi:hypothetical protein